MRRRQHLSEIHTTSEAVQRLISCSSVIFEQCNEVLGSELHYQAMIYAGLRSEGEIPLHQIGMNVKQHITPVRSALFQKLEKAKHEKYRDGFETIPDVVLFKTSVEGDWRRRNNKATLINMLMAIEVKASERANGRLRPGEITFDIDKLVAHREEVVYLGADFVPVMMVIDTAPESRERMTSEAKDSALEHAAKHDVLFLYSSPTESIIRVPDCWTP